MTLYLSSCRASCDIACDTHAWLPGRSLHLCADGAYATLARDLPADIQLTCRMRRDAALYEPAPSRTGKPGRPRTKGDRLPTPAQLSEAVPSRSWAKVDLDLRGRTVTKLVHVADVLWYKVNKTSLMRLVIVRDPERIEPDDYFFTTDLHADAGRVISRYAARWAIEVCFRDTKQDLGGQNPQSWKRRGPERAAALSLWLHAATWCWYLQTHPEGRTWTPRPWYQHKATPSFLDTLAYAAWPNRRVRKSTAQLMLQNADTACYGRCFVMPRTL